MARPLYHRPFPERAPCHHARSWSGNLCLWSFHLSLKQFQPLCLLAAAPSPRSLFAQGGR